MCYSRKFWRHYLPRLKYHNPAIAVSVNRTADQKGPAVMTVHFTDPTSATTTQTPISSTATAQTSAALAAKTTPTAATQRTATVDMKYRHESEILSELFSITKAIPVEPIVEELTQLKELEEQRRLSERDAQRSHAVNEKRKRTEAMLTQARGEVA